MSIDMLIPIYEIDSNNMSLIEKEMQENIDSIRSFWYCFDSLDA